MHAAKFLDARRGATAIQYGLIAALVAVAMAGVLPTLGGKLSSTMCSAVAGLGGNGCGPNAQTLAAAIATFNANYGATRGHISATAASGFMLTYDGTYGGNYTAQCSGVSGTLNTASTPKTCTVPATTSLAAIVNASTGGTYTNDCTTGKLYWNGTNRCIANQTQTTCTGLGGTYLGTVGSSNNMCQFP